MDSRFYDAIVLGDVQNADVITAINKVSTNKMDEESFYEILDNCLQAELSILRRVGKKVIPVTATIKWNNNDTTIQKRIVNEQVGKGQVSYEDVTGIYDTENNINCITPLRFLTCTKYDDEKVNVFENNICPSIEEMEIYQDPLFDWFNVFTYDVAVDDDDPQAKTLIGEFIKANNNYGKSGLVKLVRNEDNPDILIRLSLNSERSVNTVYVPENVQVVERGSRTTAQYNWQGRFSGFNTQNMTDVVRTGGYNVDVVNADVFYELTILDAKKMRNPKQVVPPVVWQAKWEHHFDDKLNLSELFKGATYYAASQFVVEPKRMVHEMHCILKKYVTFNIKKRTIETIDPRSSLYKVGFRKGDKYGSSVTYYNHPYHSYDSKYAGEQGFKHLVWKYARPFNSWTPLFYRIIEKDAKNYEFNKQHLTFRRGKETISSFSREYLFSFPNEYMEEYGIFGIERIVL